MRWQTADPGSVCELLSQVQKAQTLEEVARLGTEGGQGTARSQGGRD